MALNDWWPFKRRRQEKPVSGGQRGTGGGPLTPEETQAFLNGELTFLSSSNVAAAQYHPDSQELMIEYGVGSDRAGAAWIYGNISMAEAIDFIRAPSKGIWVWDHIRVRGTVHSHQVPAKQLR